MTQSGSTIGSRLADALLFSALTKVFTFTLSSVVTRWLLPEQKGVAFTLDLYADTLVFVSREALRATSSRIGLRIDYGKYGEGDAAISFATQRIINISALCVPLTFVIMTLFELLHFAGLRVVPSLGHISALASSPQSGSLAIAIFGSGIMLQMFSEPKQCIFRSLLLFRQKIATEAFALACRLATSLAILYSGLGIDSVLLFSIAHLAYGAATLAYTAAAWTFLSPWCGPEFLALKQALRRNSLLCVAERSDIRNPAKYVRRSAFPLSIGGMVKEFWLNLSLWRSLFFDSLLRIVLTEGEKFFLLAFGTMTSQGIYDMVMNLGSLVVRVIFRVWEDNCHSAWAQLHAQKDVEKSLALLRRMIKISLLLGCAFFLFGPPLSRLLLHVLYGARWTSNEAVEALQQFCLLVPLMGMNGLMEAYIRATGTPWDLQLAWVSMICSSVLYTGTCYYTLAVAKYDGASALINANLLITFIRLLLSVGVITNSTSVIASNKGTPWFTRVKILVPRIDIFLGGGLIFLFFVTRTIGLKTDRLRLFSLFFVTHGNVITIFGCLPLFLLMVVSRDVEIRSFVIAFLQRKRAKSVE
jgi:oligosaccharide translocation protein RFT1